MLRHRRVRLRHLTLVERVVAGLVGGRSFGCGEQCGELPEALDAAELAFGGEHPGGGPAQRHLAVLPVLDPPGVVANDLGSPTRPDWSTRRS